MSASPEVFDPYLQWLGIEPTARPVNHYSLLGLQLFEADPAKVSAAADERMGLIRQFQSGPRGMHTQRLLNELSAAKLCLLGETSKANYDVQLHRQMFPAPPTPVLPEPEVMPAPLVQTAVPLPRWAPAVKQAAVAPTAPALRTNARERGRLLTPFNIVFVGGLLLMFGGFGGFSLYQQLNKPSDEISEVDEPAPAPKPKPKPTPKPKPAVPAKPNPAAPVAIVVFQEGSGEVYLTPATAQLTPNLQRKVIGTREVVSGWSSPNDVAEWQYKLVKTGFFALEVQYLSTSSLTGQRLKLDWGDNSQIVRLRNEGSGDKRESHNIVIQNDGQHTFRVSPADEWSGDHFRLISVRLVPGMP